ncbi:MAG: HAD-IIIA family hydrolase [Clostridium sp.]|nr:HAD-IIIA family hydrolase [Clostridium sp.]
MKRNITTVIFDLDGTLLDTLQDLADSANHALCANGLPERTVEEVRTFVGNGVRLLMERAVPGGAGHPQFEKIFADFKAHYMHNCRNKTGLYPGINRLLHELKQRGYRLAIVSNKLQSGVTELYRAYFRDTVDVAIGERPELRRKPAPDMVELALRELGCDRAEAVYVGDSEVDVETARQAGLPCLSVLWGFRHRDFLISKGATRLMDSPSDILAWLEAENASAQSSSE